MEEKKVEFKNVQMIVRPSSPLLKVLVIVLILFSMAALISLGWVQHSLSVRTEELLQEAAGLEHENQELEHKIQSLGSVESVKDIAQEELGLVSPDTIIIKPE